MSKHNLVPVGLCLRAGVEAKRLAFSPLFPLHEQAVAGQAGIVRHLAIAIFAAAAVEIAQAPLLRRRHCARERLPTAAGCGTAVQISTFKRAAERGLGSGM